MKTDPDLIGGEFGGFPKDDWEAGRGPLQEGGWSVHEICKCHKSGANRVCLFVCFLIQRKQRHHFASKGLYSQSYGFFSSHEWMGELDHKEGWVPKNWSFPIVVLEKTLESPLDSKEIKPVNPKGIQPWIFIRRTHAEAWCWHEFGQTLGDSEGQGSLACCSPWGPKELDMTERLNWTGVVAFLFSLRQFHWGMTGIQ